MLCYIIYSTFLGNPISNTISFVLCIVLGSSAIASLLTLIAAFAFFAATVGINMVANFIPPAYDLANLMPDKINFRTGGLITAIFGFVIGGMWVAVITQMGMFPFVNTLGAILAPVFGIMIVDYYVIKNQKIDVDDLFSDIPEALINTVKLAEKCNIDLELGKFYLPDFEVPNDYSREEFLRKISNEYNISMYKLKKFYNAINNNEKFDIQINIIEEKQIKYLLFQDRLVLA